MVVKAISEYEWGLSLEWFWWMSARLTEDKSWVGVKWCWAELESNRIGGAVRVELKDPVH